MSLRDTKGRPDVSLVVPVFRNRSTLAELHRRVSLALGRPGLAHELVLVIDGCPEGSAEEAEGLAKRDGRVRVVELQQNMGQNAAALEGIRRARGKRLVLMDADLQDPPEAIPSLLEKADQGFAAVFAGRRGRYESAGRLFTSRIFKWALHRITGLPRDAGMFVLFDQRVKSHLLRLHAPRPFLVAMIGCSRLPVASVPVERELRPEGRSAYSAWMRTSTALSALWWAVRWKMRPLYKDRTDGGGPDGGR